MEVVEFAFQKFNFNKAVITPKGVGLPMLLIRDWGLTPDVFV
jgi:hypothetical protein